MASSLLHFRQLSRAILNITRSLIALRFPRICLIYTPKNLKRLSEIVWHKETKIFQKTIISPVFLPASRYFLAILNIALRY